MTSHPLIVWLTDACDPGEVGAKAANLARLVANAAPVPRGFVVTKTALARVMGDSPTVHAELEQAWRDLSPKRAIVRSSAVGEDSDTASFAGQLESVPDVSDSGTLRRALATVWASQRSDRVLAYQAARHMRLAGMGAIVQEQIAAVLSGVLFTRAPRSDAHMLLEYCAGMGQDLVSGSVNPGRVRIARSTFRWIAEATPDTRAAHEAQLLTDTQIGSLARLGLRVEHAFGSPQDIEWAMDDRGRIWIVQARPITAGGRAPVVHVDAHAAARTETVLWSNANVSENFPEPICPLLYSVASAGYYHYFRNLGHAFGIAERRLLAMEQPLRHIIGVHGGRMYYNLTSIHGVLHAAPFGDLLTATFNEFVGAAETGQKPNRCFEERTRGRRSQGVEVAVIAAKTGWQYLFLTRRVERFERTVSEFAEQTDPQQLRARSSSELLDDLRGFMDIRCRRWNDAALADAGAMVCYGVLKRLLDRTLGDHNQEALHNTLLKALPGLVSGLPPLMLWELSRRIRADEQLALLFRTSTPAQILDRLEGDSRFAAFRQGFHEYLDRWGFRCSAELMLTVPSFQEEPAPVIDLLKSYAALEGPSPVEQLMNQEAERVAETGRVLRLLRSRRLAAWLPFVPASLAIRIVLGWTQRSIQLRERARLKQALLYSRLRRIALALGERLVEHGRLAIREDIFFLTFDEVDALASGHAMFPDEVRRLVALRREAHARLAEMRPPDSMRLAAGEYLPQTSVAHARSGDADGKTSSLTGVGACGGSTIGRAAILTDVTQSHRIRPGDVLVTRQTDPGWAPIFPLISGLVIERGGMLSHGAIVAREFGIPSVVGVVNATQLIPDGARIAVDGDKGLVQINSECAAC